MADANSLQQQLKTLVGQGAEGLMLHRADALWAPGRSDALRKLKPLPDDEARVVAHVPGKGRLEGKLASTDCAFRASAVVVADVSYKTLVIDSGATVEGRFTVQRD